MVLNAYRIDGIVDEEYTGGFPVRNGESFIAVAKSMESAIVLTRSALARDRKSFISLEAVEVKLIGRVTTIEIEG